jgi:hypothetical protein
MNPQTTIKAAILALSIAFAGTSSAFSAEDAYAGSGYLMAYAEPEAATESPFDYFAETEEAHELNDAWLGMPAISREGQLVGVVSDAFIDEYGYVSEIRLDLVGKDHAVYVEGSQVLLLELEVAIDLAATTIANLQPAEDGLMISAR